MTQHLIDDETRYRLIKRIEANPKISQRELAVELGISLGKVNYCIKALVNIGWIKVGNFARSQNKLNYAYVLTPKGVREKAVITLRFLKLRQEQYQLLKAEISDLQREATRIQLGREGEELTTNSLD